MTCGHTYIYWKLGKIVKLFISRSKKFWPFPTGSCVEEMKYPTEMRSGAHDAIVPENKKKKNNEVFGVETLKLKTLLDGSDYKDYVYAIMAHRGNSNDIADLQNTGGRLIVKYGGVAVNTFPIPQGALVNTRNQRRYLFGYLGLTVTS